MKMSTKYWLAIRHVGEASWDWPAQELTVADMIREIMKVMSEVTLASQLVMAVGRSEQEVILRVNGQTKHKQSNASLAEELDAELEEFLKQLED